LSDNSKIDTAYDDFGNKTESRCFNNHLRLLCVELRSEINGQRHVLAYGRTGFLKELGESMYDKAMTASADEIADSAGFVVTRQQTIQPAFTQTTTVTNTPLKPLATNQTLAPSVLAEPVQTESVEKTEQPATIAETKPSVPVKEQVPPKEIEKTPAPIRKPEEK
jgi:hypothetical protein